jgi:hypothetical protein
LSSPLRGLVNRRPRRGRQRTRCPASQVGVVRRPKEGTYPVRERFDGGRGKKRHQAPIAAALVEEILDNPLGHANRVPAIREANLRLLGRPETTGTLAGDPDKPIRIVVESISSRRREALADVEAEEGEVEELPPGAT